MVSHNLLGNYFKEKNMVNNIECSVSVTKNKVRNIEFTCEFLVQSKISTVKRKHIDVSGLRN